MSTTTTPAETRVRVERMVGAGLDRVSAAILVVPYGITHDPAVHAERAMRLHRLYGRRARWWAVLERATVADATLPTVYVRAIVQARCAAEQQAIEWVHNAQRWLNRTATTGTAEAELVGSASA